MSRHFETTPAFVHTCGQCRATVLYGLAEGIPARVDPAPIAPAAEAWVLAAGRWTYTLRRTGLIHRDDDRRRDPGLASPILATHACSRRPR
jgi:hypothetical protein